TLLMVVAKVEAENVLFRGGRIRVPFSRFVRFLSTVQGRKVLVLEAEGDPTACERVFADTATEESLLLTSPGELTLDGVEDLDPGPTTTRVGGVHASIGGRDRGLRGAFDTALDGIEALVPADSNELSLDWLEGYTGR